MKKIKFILPVLLAGFLVSCTKDQAKNSEVGSPADITKTIVVSASATKTFMGSEEGGSVPVYWSNGDRINVNGVTSAALTVADGTLLSEAAFDVNNVEAPYKVVYPASAFIAEQDVTSAVIEVPAVQQYTTGTFAPGADILYGFSADEGAMSLSHLCATLRFNFTSDEDIVIKTLKVRAIDGEPLAGEFVLDFETGEVGFMEDAIVDEIELVIPEEGIALGAAPTPICITIPGGEYAEGFEFVLTDQEGRISTLRWKRYDKDDEMDGGLIVDGGALIDFGVMEYMPGIRIINNAEDWVAFVSACNGGAEGWEKSWVGRDGRVVIGSDFEVESLDRISNLRVTIDGCGHTITQTNATQSMVAILHPEGAIRNLTLAGAMTAPEDPENKSAVLFVTTMNGGEISNCVNKTRISYTSSATKIISAGFVRSMLGGKIVDCTNNGEIAVTVDLSAKRHVITGGIVATVRNLNEAAVVENCTNTAPITITIDKPAASTLSPGNFGLAGIVGHCVSGDADKYLSVTNCCNSGNISAKYKTDPTSAAAAITGVGGVIGVASVFDANGTYAIRGVKVEIDGCTNSGTITNDMVSNIDSRFANKNFGAGIAGVALGVSDAVRAKISGCTNTGEVVSYAGKYSRAGISTAYAGLVGLSGYVDITDCTVNCKVGGLMKPTFAVSAGVGLLVYKSTISGCSFYADLNVICSTTYNPANYSLVATSPAYHSSSAISVNKGTNQLEENVNIAGTQISNCRLGGTLTTNPTLVTYNSNGPYTTQTSAFTADNVFDAVMSSTYELGEVEISGITYWDGK